MKTYGQNKGITSTCMVTVLVCLLLFVPAETAALTKDALVWANKHPNSQIDGVNPKKLSGTTGTKPGDYNTFFGAVATFGGNIGIPASGTWTWDIEITKKGSYDKSVMIGVCSDLATTATTGGNHKTANCACIYAYGTVYGSPISGFSGTLGTAVGKGASIMGTPQTMRLVLDRDKGELRFFTNGLPIGGQSSGFNNLPLIGDLFPLVEIHGSGYEVTIIPVSGFGAGGAGVFGDPVTFYGGAEYKFDVPVAHFTTLLRSKDIVIQAKAFSGEFTNETWIDNVVIDSRAGERILKVEIRHDIARFSRTNAEPGTLETLKVTAPWYQRDFLTFPDKDVMVSSGGIRVSPETFQHDHGVTFHLIRVPNAKGTDHDDAPHREGVVIRCDSVSLVIISSSALEYYYDDATVQRAMEYAHLDLEFFDMKEESSFVGLLPEVWGLVPKVATAQMSGSGRYRKQAVQALLDEETPAQKVSASKALTQDILTRMFCSETSPGSCPSAV